MKFPKSLCVLVLATLIWGSLLSILMYREYFSATKIPVDYQKTLANVRKTEHSKMAIYCDPFHFYIGTIDSTVKPTEDGGYEVFNDTILHIKNKILAKNLNMLLGLGKLVEGELKASFHTKAQIGADYRLQKISFQARSGVFDLDCEGHVREGKLILEVKDKGASHRTELPMPENTMMGDTMGFMQKYPRLQLNQSFQVRWFDPVQRKYKMAKARVLGKQDDFGWGGRKVPVYIVRTQYGDLPTTTWVSESGEVLQYQILSFTLVKEEVEVRQASKHERAVENRKP